MHRLLSGIAMRFVALGVCVSFLVSCATNPVTGKKQFTLYTEAEEIQLGLDADRELLPAFGAYADDPSLVSYVAELGLRMAARSERPGLPWSFRVIDDEIVNAFALPGGQVYVSRGLLAHLNRESELAGVLGHEIGHVTARHSITSLSRELAITVGLAAGLALLDVEEVEPFAYLGLGVLFLKFSRDHERQADLLATRYVPQVGLDPYGAVDALRILYQVSAAQKDGGLPTWLSTHPDPERRWQRLAREAGLGPIADGAAARDDRERYVRRLDGLVYGPDPRNGILRDERYLQPRGGFEVSFPAGWSIQREGQSVLATNPAESALLMLLRGSEATPEQAEKTFLAEVGVTAGQAWNESLGGFAARLSYFSAESEGGEVGGLAAFVPTAAGVVKLVALSEASEWPQHHDLLLRSVRSFRRLADPEVQAARPARLRVVAVDRSTTLRQLAAAQAPGVEPETVALINDMGLDDWLEPGRLVKLVVPSP